MITKIGKVLGQQSIGSPSLSKPKKWKPTPYKDSTSRTSLDAHVAKIYDDNGTIYWSAVNQSDTPRWSHYIDKTTNEKVENWYGNSVNKVDGNVMASEQIQRLTKYPQVLGSPKTTEEDIDANAPRISTYANQTHDAHERLRNDMSAAMIRNGFGNIGPNQVGMINDTKRKEIIDSIATNKNEEAKTYIKAGSSLRVDELKNNSSKKYEDRYKNSKDYLTKKKIPDYTSGPMIKYDEYNKLYPIPDPTSSEHIFESDRTFKQWDLIPFILHDIVHKKYLPFRSYINSLSDQSDAEWQDVRYIGRADKVNVYSGFTRTVSMDFTTVAFSLRELHPMWQRINYLVGLTKPAGYTTDSTEEYDLATSGFIIPPFLKLNLGDMYMDQPVLLTSVAMTIPPEASWELTSDQANKQDGYQYLNNTFKTTKADQILVGRYPNLAQISISFKFLEKRLPKLKNRHFGHYRSEDEIIDPETGTLLDNGPNVEKGFNYNLIYENPGRKIPEPTGGEGAETEEDDELNKEEPDPFEGIDDPACTTYPPSKFYISKKSGMKKTKSKGRYESDYEEWKKCACENTAKMMGEDTSAKQPKCTWNDALGCIMDVNEIPVPPALQCVYTDGGSEPINSDPIEEDDDSKKPPQCPYLVGGENELNDNGELIGYSDIERYNAEDNTEYVSELRLRNLNMWLKEVCDWIADEIGQVHIGSGPYKFDTSDGKASRVNNPISAGTSLGKISRVFSSNERVVVEFNEDGHPYIYNKVQVPGNISTEFKINCTPDEVEEIREIAGNIQPIILANTNSMIWLALDADGEHNITKNNYTNKYEVRRLLAEFVSRELGTFTAEDTGTNRGSLLGANSSASKASGLTSKYGDLSHEHHKGTTIETKDIYYIPYEEDRDIMIKGQKVYPGSYDYTYYDYDESVGDRLNLGDTADGLIEMKIGFYALVSKTERKISNTPVDTSTEDNLADRLWDKLYEYNAITTTRNAAGGSMTEIEGMAGTGFTSDEDMAEQIGGSQQISRLNKEIDDYKKIKDIEKKIPSQLADPNVPVLEYRVIGEWTSGQAQEILDRMSDMKYQNAIAEKHNQGSSRISIENYLLLLLGTEEEDIETAEKTFREQENKGMNVRANPEAERETDQDYLQKQIENREEKIRQEQERVEKNNKKYSPDTKEGQDFRKNNPNFKVQYGGNDGLQGHGKYFEKKTSEGHFEPWVADHLLEKIEWVESSFSRTKQAPSDDLPIPEPTTDTPTPNRQPTWNWPKVEGATLYEIEWRGQTTVTEDNYFKIPMKVQSGQEYTIAVKAGGPDRTGGATEWSAAGRHTVKIDKLAIPPKPPKCPYAVGDVGETDDYDRQIGRKTEDEDFSTAMDRNIIMWMGDVMAYIMAEEGIGNVTFPCDPSRVTMDIGENTATSNYEQNKMVWAQTGEPRTINATKLKTSSFWTYESVFDWTCGPSPSNPEGGSKPPSPPKEPLDTPKPNAKTPTSDQKPEWKWDPIDDATHYKVSLAEVQDHMISPGVYGYKTIKDFGVISYNEKNYAKSLFALKPGMYEVSVIAEKKNLKGKILKESDAGEHIVVVDADAPGSEPITELDSPNIKGKDVSTDLNLKWTWEPVENAYEYEISLATMIKPDAEEPTTDELKSFDRSEKTGDDTSSKWKVDFDIGVIDKTSKTEYEFKAENPGGFRIGVVAMRDDIRSDIAHKIVEINLDATPSPTPVDSYCHEPNKYLVEEPGYCPRKTQSDGLSALNTWYKNALNYCLCRMNEDNNSRYASIELVNFDVRLCYHAPGQGMTADDLHNPQKITDSFFPKRKSGNSFVATARRRQSATSYMFDWPDIHKYWKQYGFTLSDKSKGDIPEDCLANPDWTPTPTPIEVGPFGKFLDKIDEYDPTNVNYRHLSIVFYPPGNKNKFFADWNEREESKLSVADGLAKYASGDSPSAKYFTVYQVPEGTQFPNWHSGKKIDHPSACWGRFYRSKLPPATYKAPKESDRDSIWSELQMDSMVGDPCGSEGLTPDEATKMMQNYEMENGATPDKSKYWNGNINQLKDPGWERSEFD